LPAQSPMAWTQIEWRNNGVRRIARLRQGRHANISFAKPAAELVLEVISLCRMFGLESNSKYPSGSSEVRVCRGRSALPSRDGRGGCLHISVKSPLDYARCRRSDFLRV